MSPIDRLYRCFLEFQRFALSIDLSCAERSGNRVVIHDCRVRIARIDTDLAALDLNSEGV